MSLLSDPEWLAVRAPFAALWTASGYAYALYRPGRLVRVALRDGGYPALSPVHPGAAWFERLAHDLNGTVAQGAAEAGTAIEQFRGPDGAGTWPELAPPEMAGVHQLGLGPVEASLAEPVHLRADILGERVLRLRARLGYAHKGTLALMHAKSPRLAARFAARIAGDATVAHGIAFARAAEAALGVAVPTRAATLRGVMAELERLANHAGDLAEMAAAVGAARLEQKFARQREAMCAAAEAAFGHRLMMDAVIPGGVAGDLRAGGALAVLAALDGLEAALPGLRRLCEGAGWQDRMSETGVIPPALAAAYGPGGVVGRASGQPADARLTPGYPPYDEIRPAPAAENAGDNAARTRLRLAEMAESAGLIRRLLRVLPEGTIAVAPPSGSGEGLGVAESARGPVWVWLDVADGLIEAVFVADPSALLWPLLERAAVGGALGDLPLLRASVNPSCAGVDL